MLKLEYELTVDDLIVEYMVYKVENGYEPKFSTSEFINFLRFFESKMQVEDSLYENEELFKRFFERQTEGYWPKKPHMEMEYSEKENDYIISANYELRYFDVCVIHTHYMDESKRINIRNIIGEFLSDQSKRNIDESIEIEEKELMIGKYFSAEIITQIWLSYINNRIEDKMWPKQCIDINKYLFDIDLAEIIGVESIKSELIELYNVMSKRIAVLYKQDKNLKVTSHHGGYLASANYELLIKGYENLINTTFGPYKKELIIDLSDLTFRTLPYGGNYYDDISVVKARVHTLPIGNDNAKNLIRNIEKVIAPN